MKKMINGVVYEMTAEEIADLQKHALIAKIEENSRPLSESDILRMIISQQINSLTIDNATASRMVDYFPQLQQDGSLVQAGTRINWQGTLKQAAVDLWDTEANNPANAPDLWADIQYRNGYRIIPETITVTTAFSEGEYGWWGDTLYRSKADANVYTPEQYPENWEAVT